jgi:hypothetical protein
MSAVLDDFWEHIDKQLNQIRQAHSAEQVIAILNTYGPPSSGDAFFAGSGGDEQLATVLYAAGWSFKWYEAGYHWCMHAEDGSTLTYVEGDVYRGDQGAIG